MSARIDRTGMVYGRLTVLGLAPVVAKNRVRYWRCRCTCGKEVIVAGNNLQSGNSTTCGCRHGIHVSEPILHEELLQFLHYESRTGKFTWLVDTRNTVAGDEAGHCNPANPYVRIAVGGQSYYAQQLAWFYVKGEWPAEEIDHHDVDHANNEWDNLRPANRFQNSWNTKPRGETGYKGVRPDGNRFTARITCKRQVFLLGSFKTAEDAARAYDVAAIEKFGEFARTNFEYQ
jgi:hypothetical protein